LRVSPAVYTAVAAARPAETARDYPLMLLGLPLVADLEVATYAPVVMREDVREDVRKDARKETPC
jgi:hypothetical protein